MIIGYAGTPGSGKSYEAVKKILDNLKLGRRIYTNIDGLQNPKCREMIKAYTGMDDFQLQTQLIHYTDAEMQIFWTTVEDGSMIVMDECHKLFSNRDWNSDSNRKFTDWASTHRHYGFDVVLITQSMEKLDKHARSLLEWTYFFRKKNQFGGLVKKQYTVFAYQNDETKGKPMTVNHRVYNSAVFACYQSYGNEIVKEVGIMKHANILMQPVFFAIPIALAFVVYFGFQTYEQGGGLGKAIAADAQAAKDKSEGKTPVKKVQEVKPSLSNVVQADKTPSSPDAVKKETVDQRTVIKAYKMPDGKTLYTNNGYIPPEGKYLYKI